MQNKFLKALIYTLLSIVLVIFLLTQPFNIYCKMTKKCYPITLSSFSILKKGNKEILVNFSSKVSDNLKDVVEFYPVKKEVSKFSNEYIENSYLVKNLTNKEITIRAKYQATPQEANKYLDRIECLCFQSQTLKAKEEIKMPIRFKIKPEIEGQKNIKYIQISYEIMIYQTNLK